MKLSSIMDFNSTCSTPSPKKLTWIAAALCVGCCAVVPGSVLLGFSALAGLRVYFEVGAVAFLAVSLGLVGYIVYREKNRACDLDCECKEVDA